MNTEVQDHGRLRLWLCLLFVVSFVVSVVVLRPTTVVPSLMGIAPTEFAQEVERARVVARGDIPVESGAISDDGEPPATTVSTLQGLVADSDPEIRLEAQTLLALVDEEAAAEYRY